MTPHFATSDRDLDGPMPQHQKTDKRHRHWWIVTVAKVTAAERAILSGEPVGVVAKQVRLRVGVVEAIKWRMTCHQCGAVASEHPRDNHRGGGELPWCLQCKRKHFLETAQLDLA